MVPEGIRVLEAADRRFVQIRWHAFDWSCKSYVKTKGLMPPMVQLQSFDSIFLGTVGDPTVPDHVPLWGLLIAIRRGFQQYVNLRTVQLFKGVEAPLKNWRRGQINFCIVRENNEGEYWWASL